ncbi:MAG TPA: hypothetical protein VLA87_04500 [Gaiellaceae bacterium]|nr:hypothetical protein [Gaiellaceae bacterium]
MFWRRPEPAPEPPLDREGVNDLFLALADIKKNTLDILAILEDEDEDDES